MLIKLLVIDWLLNGKTDSTSEGTNEPCDM